MDYDRSRLNAEIAEMEARRAAEARARQDALEREQRGPVYRGALTRIRGGIRAGRAEARTAREERAQVHREYDEQHPSDLGKKIGRTIERAAPVTEPLARSASKATRAAKQAGRTLTRQSKTAIQRYAAAQERAQKAARKKTPSSRPRTPLDGLDGMLLAPPASPATRKKKKRRKNPDDDLLGLGSGFRLL